MSDNHDEEVVARARRAIDAGLGVRLPDGRRLAYAEFGDPRGEPVFLFHGFPNTGGFGAIAHEAAADAGVRLLCPTRPGLGHSDPQPDRTLLDWPADVDAMADALNVERFGVVGVSAGGPYALACGASLDGVTAAAVLSGIGPPEAVTSLKRKLLYAIPRRLPSLARLFQWLENRKVVGDPEARRESLLEDAPPADRAVLQSPTFDALALTGEEARRSGTKPMVRELRVLGSDWGFDLGTVDVPVALYYGRKDPIVPASDGEYLAEQLPRADLTVDEDGGHFSVPADYLDDALAFVTDR